ncbi:MAG: hypothetical protein ACQEXJ_07550 [Myxococcota bacterium]
MRVLAVAWVLVVTAAGVAGAETAADHHPGEQPETWNQPPSRVQAEQDSVLVPVGKGAIFVPAMTDPSLEPPYLVERDEDGELVQTVPMGRRAVVEPGIYRVRIGSGTLKDRITRRVLVKEGRTTVVPATWSSLVVNVVDESAIPFRGSYEVVRLPERTNLGVGLGADVELGEEVRSWLLKPGSYMLIKTGGTYQARRDFYTFRLREGELFELTLVMDREDGTFLGAGELPTLQEETRRKDWNLHLVLGGDAEVNRRSDVVGFESGYGFTLGGYVDFLARWRPDRHLFYTRLKLEEKQVKLPGQSFQKDLDELRLDTLYMFRILPWLGPYVRAGTQTTLFSGFRTFDEDREVVQVDAQGEELRSLGVYDERFRLAKPLAPVELKGGAGLSFLIKASYILDANVRIGLGGRALFNRGLYNAADDPTTPEFEVVRRDDAWQYGVEAAVFGSLRASRWILATTEFEMLEPFGDLEHPVIDWETTIGFRLVSFASLNYIFKLLSDVERSPDLQTEHRLLLRFTWRIL